MTDDGRRLYVGLENADIPGLVVIDTATKTVLRKIDVVLQGGHFLAIQPTTGKLYYPMREDHRVLMFGTKTDAIVKIIPIDGGPVGVGLAPNGEVWIHNDHDGAVHIIDSKTDTVVDTMKSLGTGAAGWRCHPTAASPYRRTAAPKMSRSSTPGPARYWLVFHSAKVPRFRCFRQTAEGSTS